ncbi:hypothetical protein KKG72_02390 [bacterium]|nr:hypothetical protein [bacterium]MBU1994417.1 hypothetical protein [bacterium]
MYKFYFLLWLRWAVRLTVCSILLACGISLLVTLFLYMNQGAASLNIEILKALLDIFRFWFPIAWSVTLLISLFRGLKYIFNNCIAGYTLKLTACGSAHTIQTIGYGDLVKVWRKWFMLIIWLVGALMILSLTFTSLFTSYEGVFEWFDIYWLFSFILISGYFSFILLGSRCKKVKVVQC